MQINSLAYQGRLIEKEIELNACFLFQHLMNSTYLPNEF